MRTTSWLLVLVLVLAGTVAAWAYQPEGWLFSQWPYAYSMNTAAWYYFNVPSTQWRVSLPGGLWQLLSQGGTATGWNYYRWPYCYSMTAGGWFWLYLDTNSPQWCVNLNNAQWSELGIPSGMVLVDAGQFQMGLEGYANSIPVHTVLVDAFNMDKYEVTKAQWDSVRAWELANGYPDLPQGQGGSDTSDSPVGDNHPVVNVNWYDCVKWCNARSEREGRQPVYYTTSARTTVYRVGTNELGDDCVAWDFGGYRLPTEAEWEKAARGGLSQNFYPWASSGGSYSNWIDGSKANYGASGDPFGGTTPVGYYNGSQTPSGADMANGYGLYDMAGNVYEWLWDWYTQNYYTSSPSANPHGPDSGLSRGVRGWCWVTYGAPSFGWQCMQCGYRGYDSSGPADLNTGTGFRCVRGL